MKESDVQELLVNIIEKGQFLTSINGINEIKKIEDLNHNPEYIPNLSVDYMLRYNYAKGAMRVINSLHGELKIINGKKIRNISIDKKDRLFPDFILVNEELKKFILIELKTNGQTEREAVTELMAYSQEIKNQLPFLTNYDLNYVLISTDFNTLLDHSVGQMVLEDNQNLLCIKINPKVKPLNLSVYVPDSWTDLRMAYIPESTFFSVSIALYEKMDGSSFEDIETEFILENAIDMFCYEANRANAHGFCMGWENVHANTYILTFYIINPYKLNETFFRNRADINLENPLLEYTRNNISDSDSYEILMEISKSTYDYLGEYFNPNWETLSDLKMNQLAISRNGKPLSLGYYGVINDFIRFYFRHPGVRSFIPELTDGLLTYKDPIVGLQLIQYFLGSNYFQKGSFSIAEIFDYGKNLNLISQYLNAYEKDKVEKNKYIELRLFWLYQKVIPGTREILECARKLENVPSISFYISFENKDKSIESIYAFKEWISNYFISDAPCILRKAFEYGFCYGFLFENDFYNSKADKKSNEYIYNAQETLTSYFTEFIGILDESALERLSFQYVNVTEITFDILRQEYETILELMNQFLSDFVLPIGEGNLKLDISVLDWNWLKEQVIKLSNSTKNQVAIDMSPNGQITVVQVSEHEFIPGKMDNETEVLIRRQLSQVVMYSIENWDDLIKSQK
ncbi:TPA: hypothetical protein QC285_004071 [Bacillus cereus]|nr:hypothetical protein [Bacillus cereus]